MPNSDAGIRNLSRTIFEKLEALPAAAYMDVCWVLCSEIDRLFADRISADSRRLMGATLDELGGAIDSAEAISESPAALDLVAEWEVLSAGQIGDEATAHIYFVFGDIANMLAGRYKIGQAHSWLLNPFVDIFQNPPRNGARGYERIDNISDREDGALSLYLKQIIWLLSELAELQGRADVQTLRSLRTQIFGV